MSLYHYCKRRNSTTLLINFITLNFVYRFIIYVGGHNKKRHDGNNRYLRFKTTGSRLRTKSTRGKRCFPDDSSTVEEGSLLLGRDRGRVSDPSLRQPVWKTGGSAGSKVSVRDDPNGRTDLGH